MDESFLDLAAKRGWAVFAADAGKKFACSPHWQELSKQPDYEYLRAKLAEGSNLGWSMGEQPNGEKLVALDVEAPFVEKFLERWPELYGPIPETYAQRSKSGGLHLVLRGDVPSTKLRLDGEIIGDVVAAGKQILAAGSVVDGRPYVLLDGRAPAPLPALYRAAVVVERPDLSPAPGTWRQDALSEARAREYLAKAEPAVEGQGGHSKLLFAVVHVVKALQLEPGLATNLLLEVFNPRCVPPWSEAEVAHKVSEVVSGRAGSGVEWGQEWLRGGPLVLSTTPSAAGPGATVASSVFARVSAADMSEPLPELVYTAEALQLAPGPVTIVGGFGFSGKTYMVQQLALAVALGVPSLWGKRIKAGRVLHLDYEQGRRVTIERYQRLAAGFERQLGDANLESVMYPPLWLSASGAADILARELDAHSLCIVDSLRACAPDLDENSSEIRQVLDTLSLVSERSGCAIIVIAHAGKSSESNRAGLRGSSAIYDGASNVFILEKEEDGPIHVQQTKARFTGKNEPRFTLAFEETAPVGLGLAGIRLVRGEALSRSAKEEASVRAAFKLLTEHPDGVTLRQMIMVCPRGVLDELELGGKIVKEGQMYKRGVL